jgi:hypothetical protein
MSRWAFISSARPPGWKAMAAGEVDAAATVVAGGTATNTKNLGVPVRRSVGRGVSLHVRIFLAERPGLDSEGAGRHSGGQPLSIGLPRGAGNPACERVLCWEIQSAFKTEARHAQDGLSGGESRGGKDFDCWEAKAFGGKK